MNDVGGPLSYPGTAGYGGGFGGGGGGGANLYGAEKGGAGGPGAVRIIWGRNPRLYPNTNTANL
jgi:hypothetical protein